VLAMCGSAFAAEEAWQERVARAVGKSGTLSADGAYRIGLPRSDLKVTLDGTPIPAAFALGSWVAFSQSGTSGMGGTVMGDLVLTDREVNPVMKKLAEGGIEITALHNHLLRNQPFTMYMHVLGHGDVVKLATTLRGALSESGTPFSDAAAPAAKPQNVLDVAAIDRAIGRSGKLNGAVYQFSVPRAKPVTHGGMAVPEAMGSANGINFTATGAGRAAVTGDFVLVAEEVNPVLKALRDNGIEVTALHNHMLDEQPRLFFMHFWANDDAVKLAQGLKAALARIDVAAK